MNFNNTETSIVSSEPSFFNSKSLQLFHLGKQVNICPRRDLQYFRRYGTFIPHKKHHRGTPEGLPNQQNSYRHAPHSVFHIREQEMHRWSGRLSGSFSYDLQHAPDPWPTPKTDHFWPRTTSGRYMPDPFKNHEWVRFEYFMRLCLILLLGSGQLMTFILHYVNPRSNAIFGFIIQSAKMYYSLAIHLI